MSERESVKKELVEAVMSELPAVCCQTLSSHQEIAERVVDRLLCSIEKGEVPREEKKIKNFLAGN